MTTRRHARFATLAFAAAGVLLLGCESDQQRASKRVHEKLAQATQEAKSSKSSIPDTLPSPGAAPRPAGYSTVAAAAGEADAAPVEKLMAKARLALANLDSAIALTPQLNQRQFKAEQVMRDLASMAGQLARDNQLISAYAGSNPAGTAPAAPLAAIVARQAELKAQADAEAGKLKAFAAERDALKGKITDLQSKISGANTSAAGLMDKSEREKGEESVNTYKQAIEARRQAGLLVNELELAQADLARKERQIVQAEAAQKAALASIATLEAQHAELSAAWARTQDAIKARSADSKKLVAEGGLQAKAAELAQLKAEADQLRKLLSETYLQAAIQSYDECGKLAVLVEAEMKKKLNEDRDRKAPQRPVWQRQSTIQHPHYFKIARARAMLMRGNLAADHVVLLQSQQRLLADLKPAMQKAGITLPAELNDADLAQQIDASRKAAIKDLDDAAKMAADAGERVSDFDRVEQPRVRAEAAVVSVGAFYALSHIVPSAEASQKLLEAQTHLAKLAEEFGASLPAFAGNLESIKGMKRTPLPITIPTGAATPPVRPPVNPPDPGTTPPDNTTPPAQGKPSPWLKLFGKAAQTFQDGK